MDPRVESGVRAEQSVERERADDVRRARQAQRLGESQAGDGGHQLRAVDQGQALLGLEGDRGKAGRCQGLAPGEPAALVEALALADQHQRQVGQRRQIATGADGSL